MSIKESLKDVTREVEKELDGVVERAQDAERGLASELDGAAEHATARAKRVEHEVEASLDEQTRGLQQLADRVENGVRYDLDQVALELLHDLDDVLGRARMRVRAELARRGEKP